MRILVVNVNWIGDVVFSLPIFRAMKKAYPQATISCLAVPRVKEILEHSPFVDEIIIYDEKGAHSGPFAKLKLIWELRKRKFQNAFLLHRSLTRALIVYLAGIPQRVGYDTKGRGRFLTHRLSIPQGNIHRSDQYLNVIESYGINVDDRVCQLEVSSGELKKVDALLARFGISPEDFVILINPGGNWDLKRWPKENFSLLVTQLQNKYPGKIVISGAAKDISLANEIASNCSIKPAVLASQTSLSELLALLKRSDLLITADTGPLHLANSLGTSVIALFGPTHPEVTGPRGPGQKIVIHQDVGCNRHPCYFLECPDNICMQSINVWDVMKAVEHCLKKR